MGDAAGGVAAAPGDDVVHEKVVPQAGPPGVGGLALLHAGVIDGDGQAFARFGLIGVFEDTVCHWKAPFILRLLISIIKKAIYCNNRP